MDASLLQTILQGVKFFTKFRLIVPTHVLCSKSASNIYPWPNNHVIRSLTATQQNELISKGVRTKKMKTRYYKVPYGKYSSWKEEYQVLDDTPFIILRDYFTFRLLQKVNKLLQNNPHTKFQIKLVHREPLQEKNKPSTTNDLDVIKQLKLRGDILWVFNTTTIKTKMPAFFGPAIFNELKLFPNLIITIGARKKVSGKKSDEKSVQSRNVVLERDRKQLQEILEFSLSNFQCLIDDKELYKLAQEVKRDYEAVKSDPNWKTDLN